MITPQGVEVARRTSVEILTDYLKVQDNQRSSPRRICTELSWTTEKLQRVLGRVVEADAIAVGPGGVITYFGSETGTANGLYASTGRVLVDYWAPFYGFREAAVYDTAKSGRRGSGVWTHPDLVLEAFPKKKRHRDDPKDLFTFEIETAANFDIRSVYQAHAAGRGASYSYVLFPASVETDGPWWERIAWAADLLGIGLMTYAKPGSWTTWNLLTPAADRVDDAVDHPETFRRSVLSDAIPFYPVSA